MRILLVTPMPPRAEAPGAIPLVLHAALTGLRARHDVTLVTAAGDEPGELEAALALQQSDPEVHVVDRRRPAGLAWWRRRMRLAATWIRSGDPWRTIWFADPRVQETIDRLAHSRPFDVVAVHDNSMGAFRFPSTLPRVLTEHEVQEPLSAARSRASLRHLPTRAVQHVDRRRWTSYQPRVWRRFERIEVFSARDASRVAELAPDLRERVRINPFGIDIPGRLDPAREETGLVLFVGNYTHPPNVDAAVWLAREIVPLVRARSPAARLALLGAGVPRELRALAGDGVDVIGEVPAIEPWLERASVVAAPIRLGGGMRMKVLHALAAGKAVVTTPRGADGLLVDGGESPLLVADDADGLADAIVRLLGNPTLRAALGVRARALAIEHHSATAYAARLERVYDEVVRDRTAFAGQAGR